MPIPVTTVYTKERLLKYQWFAAASKKALWIFMAICTLWVAGCFALLTWFDTASSTIRFCLILIIVWDFLCLFCYFILPRFLVGKTKTLNTSVKYLFQDDCFQIEAENPYAHETSEVRYAMLSKVWKNGDDVYLFISSRQGYIVDLAGLSPEHTALLKNLLESVIDPKKIKWAD